MSIQKFQAVAVIKTDEKNHTRETVENSINELPRGGIGYRNQARVARKAQSKSCCGLIEINYNGYSGRQAPLL